MALPISSETFPSPIHYQRASLVAQHLMADPTAPYLAVGQREGVDVLWFQPKALAAALGRGWDARAMVRDLWPWVWYDSQGLRRHPVTGERYQRRVRWAAFRLNLIGQGL